MSPLLLYIPFQGCRKDALMVFQLWIWEVCPVLFSNLAFDQRPRRAVIETQATILSVPPSLLALLPL